MLHPFPMVKHYDKLDPHQSLHKGFVVTDSDVERVYEDRSETNLDITGQVEVQKCDVI